MKILYLIPFIIISNIYPNVLLQSSPLLSPAEIDQLAQEWETGFEWRFGPGSSFACCYDGAESSFILRFFGIPIRSYNFHYIKNIKAFMKSYTKRYYWEKPLEFENPSPQQISFDELCTLLTHKKFIFYTGAGMSCSAGVQSMDGLERSLTIDKENLVPLFKKVFFDPESITSVFSDFCNSAIYSSPTPAHYALHAIAQYKQVCIVTENVDLLQQRTGSQPLLSRSDIMDSVSDEDFKEVDIIVCIGLSHDDCGFLAHYKRSNPRGKIVALDRGIPHYLSESDYLLQDDLQVVLPKLAYCIMR